MMEVLDKIMVIGQVVVAVAQEAQVGLHQPINNRLVTVALVFKITF